MDSFYTGMGPFHLTSITSADISPDGKYVALLSGYHIFLFSDFSGDNFFGGSEQELNFSSLTQKEGIAFINDCEIYLTDEQTDTLGNTGKLYYANIGDFIPMDISKPKIEDEFVIFPNPVSSSQFEVKVNDRLVGKQLKILNSCGVLVFESPVLNSSFQIHRVLSSGIYFVEITEVDRTLEHKLIVY